MQLKEIEFSIKKQTNKKQANNNHCAMLLAIYYHLD